MTTGTLGTQGNVTKLIVHSVTTQSKTLAYPSLHKCHHGAGEMAPLLTCLGSRQAGTPESGALMPLEAAFWLQCGPLSPKLRKLRQGEFWSSLGSQPS